MLFIALMVGALLLAAENSGAGIKVVLKGVNLLAYNVAKCFQFHKLLMQATSLLMRERESQ